MTDEEREAMKHLLRAVNGLIHVVIDHDRALSQGEHHVTLGEAIDRELTKAAEVFDPYIVK